MKVALIYLQPIDHQPTGLLYIGTVLKQAGHDVSLVGIDYGKGAKNKFVEQLKQINPDVVGVSVSTAFASRADRVAKVVKELFPKIPVIFGGPHSTILPKVVLKNPCVDCVVIGEGEYTMLELVEKFGQNESIKNVNGIAYKEDNDNIVFTKPREYIDNLDELPFIDRKLLGRECLSMLLRRAPYPVAYPTALINSVRGCPYNCSFCQPAVRKIFGEKVRRRSPESLIEEIKLLKKHYGIKGLWISDDTFTANKKWASKFCDLMISENLNMTWYANGRINTADRELFTKMRDSGCIGLVMTIESGSDRVRNEVLNKNISHEQIINAYNLCKEIGIPVQTNVMVGSPSETEDDLNESVQLLKQINPEYVQTSYTTVLPGTHMYEKYSHLLKDIDYWEYFDLAKPKALDCTIPLETLAKVRDYLESNFHRDSTLNRVRLMHTNPYFRKAIFKRWNSMMLNKRPAFRILIKLGLEIGQFVIGSIGYVLKIGVIIREYNFNQKALYENKDLRCEFEEI